MTDSCFSQEEQKEVGMTTISIFGVGLMGGSLALCLKGKPGLRVIGHSPEQKLVDQYKAMNVVDEATTSFEEAAEQADIIFLCVPVGLLNGYLKRLEKLSLKPGCIITDVGSTKKSVCAEAEQLDFHGAYFIGGHPMAGSERSGVEAASSLLYENAFYVLTPGPGVPEAAYLRLEKLLQHTRAKIVRIDSRSHDEIVGAISHLPHIVAVALVNQISRHNDENSLYQQLAAGGFRDITRIASSEPVVWRDILLSNKEVVLRLLEEWQGEIDSFVHLLEEDDGEGIENRFRASREFRSRIPERRKGMLTGLHDIYVDIPDHPGIIGQITTSLGNAKINLSNIEIIESREEAPGILRLSFRNQQDVDRAVALLSPDYTVNQ